MNEKKISNTLVELALKGDTYWRFSQSVRGRSVEKCFIDYKEGSVVVAEDADKYLSFVPSSHIALCSMYGDTLTKLNFNLENPLFDSIKNEKYRFINSVLMEYDAKKLLVEKNYSHAETETIIMVIEMSSNWNQVRNFVCGIKGFLEPLDVRLNSYNYRESSIFVKYLRDKYNFDSYEELENIRNNVRKIYNEYKK